MVLQLQNYCLRTIAPIQDENSLATESAATKEKVTDLVLQTSLVGLITQLSQISLYANEVFSSILRDSSNISSRVVAVSNKCAQLNQLLPGLERHHQNTPVDKMNNTARVEFHATTSEEQQHFTSSAMPVRVKIQYDKCKPPPNLSLLDPYMDDGQKALKLYTNPQFFIDEWIAEQKRLQEEAKARRRERREARLKKKQEKGVENPAKGPITVQRIRKIKYDPITGEKILVYTDSADSAPVSAPPSASYTSYSTPTQSYGSPAFLDAPAPSDVTTASFASPPTFQQPTMVQPAMVQPQYTAQSQMAQLQYMAPQVPTQAMYQAPQPFPNQPVGYSAPVVAPNPGGWAGPAAVAVPPPPAAPAPPPPPKGGPPPPPPPSKPPGGVGSIADALGSTQLRTVEPKAKVVDSRSDLLNSIKDGMTLKSVQVNAQKTKPAENDTSSVANILSRRIAWAPSDSEDDSDDDSEEWD